MRSARGKESKRQQEFHEKRKLERDNKRKNRKQRINPEVEFQTKISIFTPEEMSEVLELLRRKSDPESIKNFSEAMDGAKEIYVANIFANDELYSAIALIPRFGDRGVYGYHGITTTDLPNYLAYELFVRATVKMPAVETISAYLNKEAARLNIQKTFQPHIDEYHILCLHSNGSEVLNPGDCIVLARDWGKIES